MVQREIWDGLFVCDAADHVVNFSFRGKKKENGRAKGIELQVHPKQKKRQPHSVWTYVECAYCGRTLICTLFCKKQKKQEAFLSVH